MGSAYDCGQQVLGAGTTLNAPKPTARAGFVMKPTPAGNQHVSMVTRPGGGGRKGRDLVSKNRDTIKNARNVAARAKSIGSKLLAASKKAPAASTRVHGLSAPKKFAKGAFHHLGPAQLKVIAQKALDASKDLLKQADKHEKQLNANVKKTDAGGRAVKAKLRSVPGKVRGAVKNALTKIHGDSADADRLMWEAVEQGFADDAVVESELLGGDASVTYQTGAVNPTGAPGAPVTPGVDPYGAGAVDPNTGAQVDPTTGLPVQGNPYQPADPTYGVGPMPTLQDVITNFTDFQPGAPILTDTTSYSSTGAGPGSPSPVPDGAIYFDGSKPFSTKSIGCFNSIIKNNEGVYAQADGSGYHWNGAWGSWAGVLNDWGSNSPGNNDYTLGSNAALKWLRDNSISPTSNMSMQNVDAMCVYSGVWGPLVGNPADPNFKGLRYDYGKDAFFWPWDQAPDWAKQPMLNILLQQAITDWKTQVTAAKTDAANQAIQDQLDQDTANQQMKQQAAEDSAMQHQIELENMQSEQQAAQQAQADEAASRQQQAQMDLDIKAQQAQAEIDRAQAQQDYEQSEAAFRAAAEVDAARAEAGLPPSGDGGAAMPDDVPSEEDAALSDGEGDGEFDAGAFNLDAGDDTNLNLDADYESDDVRETVYGAKLSGARRLRRHTVANKFR